LRVLYISLFVVLIDQVSKLLTKGFSIPFLDINYKGMYHGQRIPIIGEFFRITFIENPGMAFGFDPGMDFKFWISVFSLVASAGLIIYLYAVRLQNLSLRIALAFILGGAVGNLIDRMFYGIFYGYAPLFYGKVVDFLDFDFFNITILGRSYDRWPIFNLADSAVTIGVLILIIFYKKHDKEEIEKKIEEHSAIDTIDENLSPGLDDPVKDEKGFDLIDGSPNKSSQEKEEQDKAEDGKSDKGKEISL